MPVLGSADYPLKEEERDAPQARTRPRNHSQATIVRALEQVHAGDRCAGSGDRAGALAAYGRALDDYIGAGLLGSAASVARRMIERYPDVVRARMTLAVLALAEGLRVQSARTLRNNCSDLADYVRAVRAAGQEEIAIEQLRRFADVTESVAVRERLAEYLHALGDQPGARAVAASAAALGEALPAEPAAEEGDQRARWIEMLQGPPARRRAR